MCERVTQNQEDTKSQLLHFYRKHTWNKKRFNSIWQQTEHENKKELRMERSSEPDFVNIQKPNCNPFNLRKTLEILSNSIRLQ